jgi:hypothetical protein
MPVQFRCFAGLPPPLHNGTAGGAWGGQHQRRNRIVKPANPIEPGAGMRGHWVPGMGKWRAQVGHGGKLFYAGYFTTFAEAAAARAGWVRQPGSP